jgi:hypothetical protein
LQCGNIDFAGKEVIYSKQFLSRSHSSNPQIKKTNSVQGHISFLKAILFSAGSFAPQANLRYTLFMTLDVQHTTCIGIDIASSRRPFSYAALDSSRRLLALGQCQILEILAFTSGQEQAVIALNAPLQTSQGLMQQEDIRRQLTPHPAPGRWTEMRVAEYQLHAAGIHVPHTPSRSKDCPVWMQNGFTLAQNLRSYHYQPYPAEDAPRQLLETQTDALFQILSGQTPADVKTLEGRLQRQVLLFDQRLPVTDPMELFEEVTRYRLLRGELSINNVLSSGELNALSAAHAAWLAAHHPEQLQTFGMPQEGLIFLPVVSPQPSVHGRANSLD